MTPSFGLVIVDTLRGRVYIFSTVSVILVLDTDAMREKDIERLFDIYLNRNKKSFDVNRFYWC